jgi:hypothetical protein
MATAADATIKRFAVTGGSLIFSATKNATTTDNPGSTWVFANQGCHIDAWQTALQPRKTLHRHRKQWESWTERADRSAKVNDVRRGRMGTADAICYQQSMVRSRQIVPGC